jgi:hypothetical protein
MEDSVRETPAWQYGMRPVEIGTEANGCCRTSACRPPMPMIERSSR